MAKNSPFSGWQIFFSKTNLAYYIFGAIVTSIIGKAVYDLIIINFGNSQQTILGIVVSTIAIMLLFLFFIRINIINSLKQTNTIAGTKKPELRRGLILLVSNEEVCSKALGFHKEKLTDCWLICTQKSATIAKILEEKYQDNSISFHIIIFDNEVVYNPMVFKSEVENIYHNLPQGLEENDIILDFTGLTSIASVGAVLGSLTEGRSLQYIPGVFDDNLKVLKALEPIEVEIEWQ